MTLKLDWRALLPGGLFWRTFLLIGLLLTLSLTSWVMVLRALEVAPRATQLAQHITSIVNVTRAALLHSAPARRRALLKDLAANESLLIYVLEPEDQTKALPDAPLANALREQLRNHLGTETRVEGEVNGEPGLWVSFRLDDDNYWVRIERERLERARTEFAFLDQQRDALQHLAPVNLNKISHGPFSLGKRSNGLDCQQAQCRLALEELLPQPGRAPRDEHLPGRGPLPPAQPAGGHRQHHEDAHQPACLPALALGATDELKDVIGDRFVFEFFQGVPIPEFEHLRI